MSSMQKHLEDQIKLAFNPFFFEVINESSNHSGPATESHFKLIIVSDDFNGISLINRHRKVNELFREELSHFHAMALHTYTREEWNKKQKAPDSPLCHGGSKS